MADYGCCEAIAVAVPGPPGSGGSGGGVGTLWFNETPSGVQNGINLVFALAHTPSPGDTAVYRNGLRERLGVGYTVTGNDITFTTAPLADDELSIDYLEA